MQAGRSREAQESLYRGDNDENLIVQPREQKFYAHAYELSDRFPNSIGPHGGFQAEQSFHRNGDLIPQTQNFSNGHLHDSQGINQYNYSQGAHMPTISSSDQFAVPTARTNFDPTGQQCPPGGNPRVSTTIWEDEGTLCFQVEARQTTVARREDNDMINGTKLLNVAQMSRGKRDGILKNEPDRAVIKVGSMHLKGVWIPFERALELANKNHVTDMLYPLFVKDIKRFLYHPTNYARTTAVLAAANSRQAQQTQPMGSVVDSIPDERIGLDRSVSMPTPLDRSLSMLTPPSSASTNSDYWTESASHGPLSETHARTHSLPGTPATTPPAPAYFAHNNSQQLYAAQFHDSRPPMSANHYGQQPDMQRSYNHSRTTSMVSYPDDELMKDHSMQTRLMDQTNKGNIPQVDQNGYGPVAFYPKTHVRQESIVQHRPVLDARLTPNTTAHNRTHSRGHSRAPSKIFSTPNLTTQMGRRTSMNSGASPAHTQIRHSNQQQLGSDATLWVHQQQQMMYSTPQQASRGHARQHSGQLPQIYEVTPSCRMAYQLHGQGRLVEPYPRLAENFGTSAGSPVRGAQATEVINSPLNGKKKRERVVSDPDQFYQAPVSFEDRQESLTPPPISKKEDIEESPKRRRSERTGLHSRSGSVF